MQKNQKSTTIYVKANTFRLLKKLAAKKQVPMSDYLEDALVFFQKTSIDPEEIDSNKINVQKQLQDLKDTFISFIRKQESEHIIPIKENQQLGFQETILRLENLIDTMTDLPRNHQMEEAFKRVFVEIRNEG